MKRPGLRLTASNTSSPNQKHDIIDIKASYRRTPSLTMSIEINSMPIRPIAKVSMAKTSLNAAISLES